MASSHSKHIQDALALVSSGEVSIVLKAQKGVLEKMISNYQQARTTPTKELTELKDKLECLFFVFYRIQAFEDEVHEVQSLIQSLSNVLATLTNSSIIGSYEPFIKNDFVQSLYYLLVLAQLILVCMLQQTVKLYSRDDPTLNLWHMDDHGVNPDDCGNKIPQTSGSREEFDTQTWQCTGAKAFCCLVYAVFRQPEVDMDRADPTDVEWFLHEASLLRGYSYIRLCIIPVLQALASHDQEMSLFLLSVLKELLENIVHIFCLSVYNQANALHEKDFPYIFFPPTQAFYANNIAYYSQIRETDRHAYCGKFGMFMIEEVDTLEDILLCFGALIEVYPSFASKFWPQEVEEEEDLSLEEILQHAYQFERSRLSCFHPFLGRLFDISAHYHELVFPTMDFLADISNAPGNHSRKVCFSFIYNNTSHHPIINWAALMQKLELVATTYQDQKLAIENAPANASSMDSTYKKLMQSGLAAVAGGSDSLVPKKAVQLSTIDMEALLSITRLLHAMLKDIDLAVYFYQNHQLLGTLFSLLSCPLFIEVKQEIVGCLTCYARIDLYRAEVWQELDNSNILSLYSKTGGIKHELENVESQSGNYYLLDRFLVLMGVLFRHPLPEDLGAGSRVPGVLPYLTFIIDEVLLKAEERFYSHPELLSFQAQQYKIITRCLLIFYEILVRYQIHHVSAEEILYYLKLPASVNGPQPPIHLERYLSDLKDDVVSYTVDDQPYKTAKPKSPGYFLLLKLLSNSKLTEFLMKYLAFMTAENFSSLEADYIESELGTTLQYFNEVFIITPEHTGIIYQSHHILAKQHRLFEEKPVTLADSKVLPIQSHPIYWLEYGCSVCLAFMHEVSLRSHAVKFLRQSIDTPTATASAATPLMLVPGASLYEFAQILSNHQFTSILMQILSMTFTTFATNPSVYLYALKIMEYLAIYHTTNQSHMVSLLSAYPVETVAKLLLDDVYYLYHNFHDRIVDKYQEYHIRLLGCDAAPNSLNPEYSDYSIRQALVEMLLASYLPKHYTYAHYFMGISTSPTAPAATQMTCLDALLSLLSTDRMPLTLLEESPYLAVDVYELLFVFCQDEFCREQVLKKLREENFFAVHLNFIIYVMHFDILDFYHQIKQRYSRNEIYAHSKYAYNVDDLQVAINHSAAYIFAMVSLELVQSQSPRASVGMLTSREKLLKLLLGYCDNLDFSAERADTGVLVCNKVLMYFMSSLYTVVTSRAALPENNATKGLVRHYSRKLSIAKASASYSAQLKTDNKRKGSAYSSITYDSVDIAPIITNLKSLQTTEDSSALTDAQIKDAVRGIVACNLKARLLAACYHVITASQELFCMLFYLSHEQVLSVAEDHDRCLCILQHYISALPVLGRTGVGLVGESLARTVLSMIAYAEKQYTVAQQNRGWKYADDHMELWCIIAEKLVDGLRNRQSLADLATRDTQVMASTEGFSSEYHGLVCLAISRVLALLVDMKASGGGLQQDDDILNIFIDQKGLYICEALFPLATKGAVLWRLASISTINNLLGIMHPQSSPAANVAAKVVVFLRSSSAWSAILAELAKLLDPEQTALLEDNQLVEYAYQLVLLGYKMGKLLPGGVDMLYSSGYLTVLCHISCMGEVITMKNAFLTPKNEDLQKAVLQLFNGIVQSITMLVSDYPLAKDNARLVARFLRKNNGLVIYLLRLQDSSIAGVQALSSVLSLLLASLSSLTMIADKNWRNAEVGQELLGEIQELLPDCLAWLKVIGSSFLPGAITSHFHLRGFAQGALGNSSDVWSEVFRVISAGPSPQSEWEDVPSLSWSAAMQTQLESVMSVFVAVSSILRKYSFFTSQHLNVEVIGSAYLNVVQIWLQLAAGGGLEEVSLCDDEWKSPGKKKSLRKWLQGICTIVASNILNILVIVAQSDPSAVREHRDVLTKLLDANAKASVGSSIAILTRQLYEETM